MGMTFCSIHVYCAEPIVTTDFKFRSFSQGWQTYMPGDDELTDPVHSQNTARMISRAVNAPVLWFYLFDDVFTNMEFYLAGKPAASYSCEIGGTNKNLFQIPQMVGYADGQKRRLTQILNCPDVALQIDLLEEYLGVCLIPCPELLNDDPHSLQRTRGDKRFREYMEEEKRLTGKRAPIQAELVQELNGLLDNADWHCEWFERKNGHPLPYFKEHYYLHSESKIVGAKRTPVCFRNGMIEFISAEEMRRDGADQRYPHRFIGNNRKYKQQFHPARLVFSDTAPAAYAGKTMVLPRGMYGLGFDRKDRLVLYDDNGTFTIVDENMNVIAKQHLKGKIQDIDGDHILAIEYRGLFYGTIRVYRVYDK